MGVIASRKIAELGRSLTLAPERFDPRRSLNIESETCLADLVDIVVDTVSAASASLKPAVLVLDTTHAYDGVVISRHGTVDRSQIGSAKKMARSGDVIISRLRPYLRQVALLTDELFTLTPDGNDVCVSTEFFVLRSKNSFPAAALVPLLLTSRVQAALAAGQEGGHHPRFSRRLLEEISVPARTVELATETADRVKEMASLARRMLAMSRALVGEAEQHL